MNSKPLRPASVKRTKVWDLCSSSLKRWWNIFTIQTVGTGITKRHVPGQDFFHAGQLIGGFQLRGQQTKR